MTPRRNHLAAGIAAMLLPTLRSVAVESTNSANTLLAHPALPDAGPSLLRVLGALALVIGLFLGGVWMFRNGRRFVFRRGRSPGLKVLESHFLGGRQALYVVAYEQQRFLVASTPTGINLLSNLPALPEMVAETKEAPVATPSFSDALALVLKGQFAPKSGAVK
ncbi:MAG: FliO/MopB family protein [Limisphaerales bacterium]